MTREHQFMLKVKQRIEGGQEKGRRHEDNVKHEQNEKRASNQTEEEKQERPRSRKLHDNYYCVIAIQPKSGNKEWKITVNYSRDCSRVCYCYKNRSLVKTVKGTAEHEKESWKSHVSLRERKSEKDSQVSDNLLKREVVTRREAITLSVVTFCSNFLQEVTDC